ncbi:MAG: U32 family peptidase [Clostridia bacterium]|nr:U32 family peptidase [Clostridia bacterium]
MARATDPKTELLCPAGSPDALAAAIEGGADAIYMGGVAFNARIHAKNFTPDELRRGIALAHDYGVKVYLTANTVIYDKETEALLRAAEDAYLSGADALIVADLGASELIRQRISIPLHASTQCAGHNADAARRLAQAGFSRMVCAREMSREDLRTFVKSSPIEAEVFVHGALCVCHSGQCLFSSLVGGRSGNRGECAQPCRLPFKGKGTADAYPLSLKDLSLAAHVPELMAMGIASFKIEGRMKSPEYVRDVARIWRRLIDENRGADGDELARLASIFSRGGLTDGYYEKRIGKQMLGIRSDGDKQRSRSLEPFGGIRKKIPLTLSAVIRRNTPATLTLQGEDGRSVTVCGVLPEVARTAPLSEESVRKSLTKFGNTPYVIQSADVELEEGLILPVSAMNALRRAATEAFSAKEQARQPEDLRPVSVCRPSRRREPLRSAVFYCPDRIPEAAHEFFDVLYAPMEGFHGSTNGVLLPSVIFDSEWESAAALLRQAKARGAIHALFGNVGHLSLVREAGLIPHGDFRLNITNSPAAAYWESAGLADQILSPELTLAQLRDIGGRSGAVVYGRIPLMVTEKCVGRELGDCATCKSGKARLVDRRGISFPILREWEHRSLILNSVPVYMADRQAELARMGILHQHFIFTTETEKQIEQILLAYQNGTPPASDVRRIK